MASTKEPYHNCILHYLVIPPAGRPIYEYKKYLDFQKQITQLPKTLPLSRRRSLLHLGLWRIMKKCSSRDRPIFRRGPDNARFIWKLPWSFRDAIKAHRSSFLIKTNPSLRYSRESRYLDVQKDQPSRNADRHDLESFYYVLIWPCSRQGLDLSVSELRQRQICFRTGTRDRIKRLLLRRQVWLIQISLRRF